MCGAPFNLKGKDRHTFFCFLAKIMFRDLEFASEKHKILFFIEKSIDDKMYDHS